MTIARNIVFQKLTALVLLALLLVIHGVKLFHSHRDYPFPQPVSHNNADISIVTGDLSSQHCAICDFQLTRDADVIVPQPDFLPIPINRALCCYYVPSWHSTDATVISLRGPPAIA